MEEDTPETNIFGESTNKANKPHEANIFEQAAAEETKSDEPHEANIFEQAAQAESESKPEPESEPGPEPKLKPEPVETSVITRSQPVVGEGTHDINHIAAEETPAGPAKKKKGKKWLVFLIVVALLIGGGLAAYFFVFKKGDIVAAEHEKKIPAPEAYSTEAKLRADYEAGAITADTYFTQLYYSVFKGEQLDEKYKADDGALVGRSSIDVLLDLFKNHRSEISSTILEDFATKYALADVAFGTANSDVSSATNIRLAKEEAYSHRLDKVISSEQGNFLIWYTTSGDDAISDEQAKAIAKELESSITKYTELTGVAYSYDGLISGSYTGELSNSIITMMKNSNIDSSKFFNSMSVYVLHFSYDNTVAYYDHASTSGVAADVISLLLNARGNRGAAAWPNIVIDSKKGFTDNNGVSQQAIDHELYHHYQVLICSIGTQKNTDCDQSETAARYTEATANYASSMIDGAGTMLNGWAGIYYESNSVDLREKYNPGGYGYGQFPYFYSYRQVAGFDNLVEAQKAADPYQYLQDHTAKDTLINVINDSAYRTLSHDFNGNNSYKNEATVTFENDGDYNIDYSSTINAGAMNYYVLGKDWSLSFSSANEYISGVVIGYKNNTYSVIKTDQKKIDVKSTDFSGYENYYFAVTNGNLINSGEYHIKFELRDAPGTLLFRNKYDNYAVDLTMHMKMGGITVDAKGTGVVDEKHQREYLKTTMTTVMSMEIEMETYSDFYNGIDYYQNPESSLGGNLGEIIGTIAGEDKPKWLRQNTASHTLDIDFVAKKMMTADKAQKVGDGHYKLKMTAAELADLMKTANSSSSDANYQIMNGEIDVDVYIDKYGRISKLDYDFSSLMSGIDEFTCTMVLSKYNEAGNVMIPPSILSGAVEEKAAK